MRTVKIYHNGTKFLSGAELTNADKSLLTEYEATDDAFPEQYYLNADGVLCSRANIDAFIKETVDSIQKTLDAFAKTRGYDSILSACTYATSIVPKFAREGQDAVEIRDATWAACHRILDEVNAGTRSVPTFSEVNAELPPMVWSTVNV